MDLNKKDKLIDSLKQHKMKYPQAKTKMDFSEELFIPRDFWYKRIIEIFPKIKILDISDKSGDIKNELTDYRYDVVLMNTISTTI